MVTTEVPEEDKPSSPLAQSPPAENSAGPSVPASREVQNRLENTKASSQKSVCRTMVRRDEERHGHFISYTAQSSRAQSRFLYPCSDSAVNHCSSLSEWANNNRWIPFHRIRQSQFKHEPIKRFPKLAITLCTGGEKGACLPMLLCNL